jgi:hypothetical protein
MPSNKGSEQLSTTFFLSKKLIYIAYIKEDLKKKFACDNMHPSLEA